MARGDAWRLSGGVYIPNSRFSIDSDFLFTGPTVSNNDPDGWSFTITSGTVTRGPMEGFSSPRALRILMANAVAQTNKLTSGRSPSGGLPVRANVSGRQVRFRLKFWYQKSNASNTITPSLIFYNAAEDNSPFSLVFTSITSQASAWTEYDASGLVNFNALQTPGGFLPHHARLEFLFGGSATSTYFHISDITVGYPLLAVDGSNGYDSLSKFPLPAGLSFDPIGLGEYSRNAVGQMRRVSFAGTNHAHRLRATFEIALDADRKLFQRARALNEGEFAPEEGDWVQWVAASPIVVEPFIGDGATKSAGKIPENFYAWMTEPPSFEPGGYLGNYWRGSVGFEEVG